MAGERIRVFIAGNIYVKRALVRRFLEDDGFEVIGEARTREDAILAVRRDQPDAVVVDDELLQDGPGGGTIGRLRRAAPDARVVVFTSDPVDPATAPSGADGYLEKGLGLASLTSMLGRLVAEPAVRSAASTSLATGDGIAEDDAIDVADDRDATRRRELVGAAAGAADVRATGPAPSTTPRSGPAPGWNGGTARVVAILAGTILIGWGVAAMVLSGGPDEPVRTVDRTDTTEEPVVDEPVGETTPLDRASATLDDMIAALRAGNYVLATVDARTLMDLREQALASGFAIAGLDAEITARLEDLARTLPTRVTGQLADILGSLYPRLAVDAGTPGGGSGVVLGTTPSPPTRDVTGDGSTTDGDGGDRGPSGDGGSDGGEGPGTEPGTEPEPGSELGPGDGRSWGLSHNPHGGPPGLQPGHGTPSAAEKKDHDGGKPPWAA